MNKILLALFIFLTNKSFSQCGISWYEDYAIVGYWFLNGNAIDNSQNQNHGTSYFTTPKTNRCGNHSKSIEFNGVDSKIEITNTNYDTNNVNSTIAFWVYPNDTNKTSSLINIGPQNDSTSFDLVIFENGFLGIQQNGERFETDLKPIKNTWNFIYIVKNDSVISFTVTQVVTYWSEFSDPNLSDTIIIQSPTSIKNSTITLGFNGNQDQSFDGSMDNLVIHNYNFNWPSIYSFYIGGPTVTWTTTNQSLSEEKVKIYPNPTTDKITIEIDGEIKIINTFGQTILADYIHQTKSFNVSSWSKGIYTMISNKGTFRFQVK